MLNGLNIAIQIIEFKYINDLYLEITLRDKSTFIKCMRLIKDNKIIWNNNSVYTNYVDSDPKVRNYVERLFKLQVFS